MEFVTKCSSYIAILVHIESVFLHISHIPIDPTARPKGQDSHLHTPCNVTLDLKSSALAVQPPFQPTFLLTMVAVAGML